MQPIITECRCWFSSLVVCCLVIIVLPLTTPASAQSVVPHSQSLAFLLVDADGSNPRTLLSFEDKGGGSPQWSPDGKFIAYDIWDGGESFEDAEIEILDLETKKTRRLGKGAMPSWSPDGKQIVCHTYDTPSRTIVVMEVDGKGREQIMDHWGSPRWSPIGNRILAPHSQGGIAVFDIVTGKEWKLLPNHRAWQGMSISSDGRQICFGQTSGGVVLANLSDDATQAVAKTIVDRGASYQSAWSPDGKQILFSWRPRKELSEQIYLYDVNKGGEPILLSGQDPKRQSQSPAWSPDGKRIVYSSVAYTSPTE